MKWKCFDVIFDAFIVGTIFCNLVTEVQGFIARGVSPISPTPAISGEQATRTLRAEYRHTNSPYFNIRTDEPELNIYQAVNILLIL